MANKPKPRPAGKKSIPAKQETKQPKPAAKPDVDWSQVAGRWAIPALTGLMAAGFLVRALHLSDLSLWMDEYVHVMRAKNFLEGDGPLLTNDNNGILLTLILLPFFALFGPKVFWARFPSVLFGVATIWLVYRMGTRLFNRYVGLVAAGGATFSLYLIFWSRMCRNYAILGFFYLLLGLAFLAFWEVKQTPGAAGWWERNGLSLKHLLALPVVGALSLLSHQLTFFFIFSVAVYAIAIAVKILWDGTEKQQGNKKYLWLAGGSLPFLLMILVPPLGDLVKKILKPFLLSDIADWAFPDWERLAGWFANKPFEAFNVYNELLKYDLNWMLLPALAGFAAAFRVRPKSGAWLLAGFAVPFLLLSFVFREPFLNRYLIFAYPYILISVGVFFYAVWQWLSQKVWPQMSQTTGYALLFIPFVLLFLNARRTSIADLALGRVLTGHVIDPKVSGWAFTNWKDACAFVDKKRQPGDMLMSTVPTAVSYYLNQDKVLWFRQAYYDTGSKSYKLNPPNPGGGPGAASFEDLVRTVQQTPRGWLMADYYLDNIFTDERALLWVYQNMHYYPEATGDGTVMVFGWDNAQPKPERQNLVVELGQDEDKTESKEYHMTLPQSLFTQNEINLTVRTQGIDSNREALVLFNGQNAVWLPPNDGPGIEEKVIPLDKNWIKPGSNAIQIIYETKRPGDPHKGFRMFFLSITGK